MRDENKERPPVDAETGRIPPTKATVRSARIAALVRKNRVLLHRLALAASLLIVSISLLFFVRTVIKVDPRQLQAAFAATGFDQIALAFALSGLSYLALTGYDGLALR